MVRGLSKRQATAVRVGGLVCVAMLVAYVVHALTGVGDEEVFGTWMYEVLLGMCGLGCLVRARLLPEERVAWALLGIGVLLYTAGEIYFAVALANDGSVPIPSLADAGWLALYPFAYAALVVLLRDRLGSFPVARWLDGLIVGTAVAGLVAALALKPIVDASTEGSTAAVATNLAYPLADLTLLSLVFTAATLADWRPGRAWAVLGAGLALLGASDVIYLLQVADGTYVEGTVLDAGWPLGVLLLAAAAWIEPARIARRGRIATRTILVPAAAALVAIGIQAAERFTPIPPYAQALSLLTLLAVVLRLVLTLRESCGEARSHLRESRTDELTGLPNRRALIWDLDKAIATPRARGSLLLLALFDLDGFKLYNDAFGHPAGDALLARLGGRLGRLAAPRGRAYRLGGDEFCLLVECRAGDVDALIAGAGATLRERGEGFEITASHGSVLLPSEAATVEAALQLADRRMYADKESERTSAGSQSRDVLLAALRERQPSLAEQSVDVADLAAALAEDLGMSAEERDETYRAAQLHEVGKMAIPDAILNRPGPLEDHEWEFIHRHPLIGERIISSAPALVPVARLVRSSGERWDGRGFPDGLRGEEIPRGSRVIAVCGAYAAMISERAHSVAMRPERALEELRLGAGSQFDPEAVAAFERIVRRPDMRLRAGG